MVAGLWNGTASLGRLRGDMDRLFDRVFNEFPQLTSAWGSASAFPTVNLWQDDRNVYAEAELPGVSMDDIEVSLFNNELVLKGERNSTTNDGATYHRRERGVGSFNRVFHLPVDIDGDNVEATLSHGVLLITMPKAKTAVPRKVEIRAASK